MRPPILSKDCLNDRYAVGKYTEVLFFFLLVCVESPVLALDIRANRDSLKVSGLSLNLSF